jgi:hypothetical protein
VLSSNNLIINDTTRQARARILKIPQHQISREEQQLPLDPLTERRNNDDYHVLEKGKEENIL